MKKFGHQKPPIQKPQAARGLQPEKTISALAIQPRPFTKEESSANFPPFLACYEKLFKSRKQTDTKVTIGKETFDCHMTVLKCYSEHFAKLDENKNLDMRDVILQEEQVTAKAFEKIYKWMLSDDGNVARSNFAEVFKAAKYLKISELTGQMMCIVDDKKIIGEREALSLYLEAKEVNEKTLQSFMMSKISKIFLTFVASWEYLMLSYEEVEQLFKSNRLGVNSELDMLFAAIRWLQHDWPCHKKCVPKLLNQVRFELIRSWQLVELKKYPKELEHIFKSDEVQAMIDRAMSYISLQYSNQEDRDGSSTIHVISRRIINDPMWDQYEFEMNPNFVESYGNFCKYLSQLNATHWTKLKYADPQHEALVI